MTTRRTRAVLLLLIATLLFTGVAWPKGSQGEVAVSTPTSEEQLPAVQNGPSEQDLAALDAFLKAQAAAELDAFLKAKDAERRASQPRMSTPANYDAGDGSRWDQLAKCECGGNWACNTGNGFGGGLQFMHQSSYSTWLSFGGGEFAPHPWEATREQQIVIAERVLARSGWNAWPGCSRKFGWI